jgi:hypothetical protein
MLGGLEAVTARSAAGEGADQTPVTQFPAPARCVLRMGAGPVSVRRSRTVPVVTVGLLLYACCTGGGWSDASSFGLPPGTALISITVTVPGPGGCARRDLPRLGRERH